MRMRPEGITEADANIRWGIAVRLRIVEEVACGLQTSRTGAPGMREAMECIHRALERRDRKAEDAAVVDRMRAELQELWWDYPERWLLTDLYQRTDRRRDGSGSADSRRLPDEAEGLRVARGLLAEIPATGRLDAERESAALSKVLADQWLAPSGVPSRPALREYIRRSKGNRAYFDALGHIEATLHDRGKAIPGPLAKWREEVASGLRRRPARKPVPSHRPPNPAQLPRDMQIQFVIEVLDRIGIKPNGSDVSGCRIVADVLRIPEERVRRIWKARVQKGPFVPAMQKQMKAIAERNGPFIPRRPEPRSG